MMILKHLLPRTLVKGNLLESHHFYDSINKTKEITRLSFCLLANVLSVLLSFGQCIVCPSIRGFWLPLWYLQTFLPLSKRKRTKGQTIIYKTNPTKNQVLTQVTGNQFLVHFCHLSCYKWKLYTRGQTLDEGINDLYVTII
jgi:hypothetical protein